MSILFTLTLAAVVLYYGVSLIWQYHKTREYERQLAERLYGLWIYRRDGRVEHISTIPRGKGR